MPSANQTYTRPIGEPKGTEHSSTQYAGIYLKVQYPNSSDSFDVIFNSPIITSLGMSSTPQWGVEPAAGRADPLYRYESFTRELRLSFNLPAHSAAEHDDNYLQLNRLQAATLPYYDVTGNNGFNGCHIHFFIGGAVDTDQRLLQGVGLLNTVDLNWDERVPWSTADSPNGYTSKIIPEGTTAPIMTSVQLGIIVVSLAKQNKRYHLVKQADPTEMFYLKKFSK